MGASWGVSAQAARESATAGMAAARACLLAVLGSGGRGPGASVAGLCGSLLPGLQTVPPHRVLPWQRASEPSVSSPAHRDASFLRLRPPPCCSFDFHHLLRPSSNADSLLNLPCFFAVCLLNLLLRYLTSLSHMSHPLYWSVGSLSRQDW